MAAAPTSVKMMCSMPPRVSGSKGALVVLDVKGNVVAAAVHRPALKKHAILVVICDNRHVDGILELVVSVGSFGLNEPAGGDGVQALEGDLTALGGGDGVNSLAHLVGLGRTNDGGLGLVARLLNNQLDGGAFTLLLQLEDSAARTEPSTPSVLVMSKSKV